LVFGDKAFRAELIEQMSLKMGAGHYGEERHKSEEQKAERILNEELKRRGWREPELGLRPKADKLKIALAQRLRKETTMSLKWIVVRLRMGSWSSIFNLLAASRNRK
jgi:hypothetical protein